MKNKACRGKSAAALLAAFVLCIAASVGCGRDDSQQKHYYMMEVEVQEYLQAEGWKTGWLSLGRQFHGDEAVRLWSESKPNDGGMTVDVYLSHEDGSSELLYQDMPQEFRRGTGWLDRSGNLYFWNSEELAGLDGEGNILFRTKIKISGICQSPDGRIWLLLPPDSGRYSRIAEMDAKTGVVTEKDVGLKNIYGSISADEDGLLLLNSEGIWRLNLNNGSTTMIMNFTALSYRLESADSFRLSEEGGAEILKVDAREILRAADVSEMRKVVVLRDWDVDYMLKNHVYNFNRSSEEYYVVLEEGGDGENISDFRLRTGIELSAGRGADIIASDAMPDVMGYIRNGTLEDLTPYLENTGTRKEDFFPAAFEHWAYDGKIYGVETKFSPSAIWIDEEVLGGREVPDVETLVAAMLDYQGEKKWLWPSDWILNYLLRGSENLWGMVDWERGSCDFTGKLFLDMLKAAEMHGGSPAEENVSTGWAHSGYARFDSDEKMAAEGRVNLGFLFDDGSHALLIGTGTLAVNSNSQNKDGAWAFICYLLDRDIQKKNLSFVSLAGGNGFPVSREAFDELGSFMESEVNKVSGYSVQEKQDIVDPKRHDEIRAVLEDARFAPINIGPILDIILDEADWYFNGNKSAEEVCGVIQNRVKLYLEENR